MAVPLTAIFISIILASIIYYLHWIKNYWKRRGVPSYGNILTGCFTETFKAKENLSYGIDRLYHKVKHEKFIGTYLAGQPLLIINDPDIIKHVTVTEYPTFSSHGYFQKSESDFISGHLFNLKGTFWKSIRSKMTPAFSSGKIKSMFGTVLQKVEILDKKIAEEKSQVVDCYDVLRRLFIDITWACFFGIESDCLGNEKSVFMKISYLLNPPTYIQFVHFLLLTHHHKLSDPLMAVGALTYVEKKVSDFVKKLSGDLVKMREKDSESRGDFMDLMVKLKNAPKEDNNASTVAISQDIIAAQLFVIYAAGFETTSQTSSHALFEIAKQPEIWKKMQDECDRILRESGGKITYECVAKMEYTDRVIKETLRLYPALQFLLRSAIKPCKLPTTDLQLEKDTNIWIPLRAIQKDPQYYPDPEKFDPERFSPENIKSSTPFTYMPFGEGPRTCIGMRFAMMALKTTFLVLLSKYNVESVEEAPKEIAFEPLVYFPSVVGSCHLKFVPRYF